MNQLRRISRKCGTQQIADRTLYSRPNQEHNTKAHTVINLRYPRHNPNELIPISLSLDDERKKNYYECLEDWKTRLASRLPSRRLRIFSNDHIHLLPRPSIHGRHILGSTKSRRLGTSPVEFEVFIPELSLARGVVDGLRGRERIGANRSILVTGPSTTG